MRRLSLVLGLIAMVMLATSIAPVITPVSAQTTAAPKLLVQMDAPKSRLDKFPSITTSGETVFIAGNRGSDSGSQSSNAYVWTLDEQATSIGGAFDLGAAQGKQDYTTASVATAPDGTIYVAWGNIAEKRIYIRHRDTEGNWGSKHLVTSGFYPVYTHLAVDKNGKVFVTWQEPERAVLLRVSSDGGSSWSETYDALIKTYTLNNSIATGPNGEVVIGFATKKLAAAVAFWTGSGLAVEQLTGDNQAGNTGVTVGADGTIYAAWRGLATSGTNSGVFYGVRQASNSWAKVHLREGDVKNSVGIVVDIGGAIHLGWNAMKSGNPRFYYSFREAGATQFSSAVPASGSPVYNSSVAVSSGGAYFHAALENGSDGPTKITYVRYSGSTGGLAASPVIESGAATVGGQTKTAVQVTFKDMIGVTVNPATTQVRWHWGSAPTDANMYDADSVGSGGWKSFPNPSTDSISVPIPSALRSSTTCQASTLYTQVRDTSRNLVDNTPRSSSILIDEVVQGSMLVENPFLHPAATALNATLAADSGPVGAGDPRYTRVPLVYLSASTGNDCTGFGGVSVGTSADALTETYGAGSSGYNGVIPLPDWSNPATGERSVYTQVRDGIGNATPVNPFTLIYDVQPPVIGDNSAPTSSASTQASSLVDLTFGDAKVTDDLYSLDGTKTGRPFWGVWIANSLTAANTQTELDALKWAPVQAPGTDRTFTIKDWSLAYGLSSIPANHAPTDVYVYVRYLDGAGNPSTTVLKPVVINTTFTEVNTVIPLVVR